MIWLKLRGKAIPVAGMEGKFYGFRGEDTAMQPEEIQ
jgi:hypothetical protein